jgi:hypothetical protein
MLVVLLSLFLYGFLSSNADNTTHLGTFNANLNQPFNPNAVYAEVGSPYADFSRFIPPLPLIPAEVGFVTTSRQSEGNSYPGLGIMIFVLISLFVIIYDFKSFKSRLSDKRALRRVIFFFVAFLAFYVYALSPSITLGDRRLFGYYRILPGFYTELISMFRSTGRFLWVCVYAGMIMTIWVAVKRFKKPALLIMAALLVLVQFADQYPYLSAKGYIFRKEQVYETSMQSEIWDVIARDYDHFFYMDNVVYDTHIVVFTSRNHLTISESYVARKDRVAIDALKSFTWEQLVSGAARTDTVYLFNGVPELLIQEDLLVVYLVDDLIIGVADEIENAENMYGVIRIT